MTNTQVRRNGRHLVLVDIENIAGTPSPSPDAVRVAIQKLEEIVPGFKSAQKVVGVQSPGGADGRLRGLP